MTNEDLSCSYSSSPKNEATRLNSSPSSSAGSALHAENRMRVT